MIEQIRLISTAFAFLTRIPVGGGTDDVDRAAVWFPLVGLAVGTVVGCVHVGLSEVTTPPVGAAVAIAVGVGVTGGFHEDGLGDTADGFGGGWTRERRLEIMRDSRLGTYGVLAIVISVVIRVAALASLSEWRAVTVVAGVHLLSRNWAMLALGLARPARHDGLAATSSGALGRGALVLVAGAWVAVAAVALGPVDLVVVGGVGALGSLLTVALSYRKIDGVTGDVLGALEQVAETAGMVATTFSRGT